MCPDFYWPPNTATAPVGGATAANQVIQIAEETQIANNTTGLSSTIAPKGSPSPADALQVGVVNGGDLVPITEGQATSANSIPVVVASDQSAIPVTISSGIPALQNVNVTEYGSTATTLGQKTSAASIPTVIASDQSAIPVSGTVTVVQPTGSNLHVDVDNFPATQPVSGTVTANQGTANATPWNENIAEWGGTATTLGQKTSAASVPVVIASDQSAVPVTVGSSALPTGASTAALQSSVQGTVGAGTAATNSELIGGVFNSTLPTLTTGQQAAVQLDASGRIIEVPGTPAARTVTQAAIATSTTAVRLTVSGAAPSATRVVLSATPIQTSTNQFYIGSSTVTATGATRGIEVTAGQAFTANNDAGDYWVVSSAADTIFVMEQA